jgi:hypothetical protein
MFNFFSFPSQHHSCNYQHLSFFFIAKKKDEKNARQKSAYHPANPTLPPSERSHPGGRAILLGLRADQLKIFVNSFSLGACRLIKFCHKSRKQG